MYNHHVRQAFGRYHTIKLLGVGGFAQVYLAEANGSQVAIKVLNAPAIDESEMQLFINEAQKLSQLQHPHIVKVLDFNVKGNTPYLVMEYAPNGTLAQKHRDKSPLPYPTIVTYVNQIASALQYVHDRNLVHCDVKPPNLLLGKNNEVILGDFGIVTATRTNVAPTMDHIHGTAPYMAPEHSAGRPVRASDQYSLAVIIYEWLCGQLPFQGSPDAIYRQHQMDEPPPLRRKDNGASIQLQITRVVLKALEKDPKRRYTTVQEFARALEKALQPILAPPQSTLSFSSSNQSPLVIASPENQAAPNDLTVASSSPFLPIPSTPPTLPVDALIQRQQEFLQNFQAIQGEHEQKKSELELEQQEKMATAIQQKESNLAAAEQETQDIHRSMDSLGLRLQANGWDGWLRNSTDLMLATHLLKAAESLPIAPSSSYAQKMEAYRSPINGLYHTISTFLNIYRRPLNLIYTCLGVAVLIVIVLALLLHFFVNLSGIFTAVIVVVMLTLIGLGAQLFLLDKAYVEIKEFERLAQNTYQQECTNIGYTYQQHENHLQRQHTESIAQLEQRLQQQLAGLHSAFAAYMRDLGYAGADWQAAFFWERWHPDLRASIPLMRIGSLFFNASLPIFPALVPCPRGCNIVFEAEGAAKEKVASAIQSLILRLLATQPSGKVQFAFVDPDKLGGTVNAFFNHQTDADTILGTARALIHTQDIKQHLRKLIDHIAHFKPADGLIETQYVLLVMDFPANFTQEAAEDLLRIARNGPLAGVSTIVVVDTSDPTRSLTKFDPHLQALEKGAILITWDETNQQFNWQDSPLQGGQLRLDEVPSIDAPPPQDLFKRILRELSREAQTSTSVASLFSSKEIQARTNRGKIWLGQSLTNKEPATLTFRRQSNKNLLLVGTDEAAAQDMLILSMLFQSVYYSPQQAQFYVVDLRVEDTFEENLTKKYEKNAFEVVTQLLPAYFSRPSVTLPTMRSDLPRLLSDMSNELADREDGKITIASPSCYLFIHGLQFAGKILQKGYANNDSAVFRDAAEKFSHILHNGSRMGIHTLIWSDEFSSLETSPGNDILRCFDYRVALHRSSKEDVTKLFEGLDTFPPAQQQASFFSRDKEKVEKFHPYNIPSQAWLETTMKRFQP